MSDLIFTQADGVLQIGLNRPDKMNALNVAMYDGIRHALDAAQEDLSIKAILIHGSEACFTAGNDLADFERAELDGTSPGARFLHSLHNLDKPIVAAVSGIAVGIGATMLLHCDLVYAADTKFSMPFIKLGVCPEAASSYLLPKMAGHRKAAEILMLGEFFDTQTAIELGLVNQLVDKRQLLEFALQQAKTLAAQPAEALLTTKRLMKKAEHDLVRRHMDEEFHLFNGLLNTPESKQLREQVLKRA